MIGSSCIVLPRQCISNILHAPIVITTKSVLSHSGVVATIIVKLLHVSKIHENLLRPSPMHAAKSDPQLRPTSLPPFPHSEEKHSHEVHILPVDLSDGQEVYLHIAEELQFKCARVCVCVWWERRGQLQSMHKCA